MSTILRVLLISLSASILIWGQDSGPYQGLAGYGWDTSSGAWVRLEAGAAITEDEDGKLWLHIDSPDLSVVKERIAAMGKTIAALEKRVAELEAVSPGVPPSEPPIVGGGSGAIEVDGNEVDIVTAIVPRKQSNNTYTGRNEFALGIVLPERAELPADPAEGLTVSHAGSLQRFSGGQWRRLVQE